MILSSAYYIADSDDFTDSTGAGTDGYSVVWDNGTSKFILTDIAAGAGHLLADGTVTGATSQAQVFTNGVTSTGTLTVGQNIRPDGDAVNAIVIQNAAGSKDLVTFDTTNNIVYIDRGVATNTFIGGAGNTTLSGTYNVGIGASAGQSITTGIYNNCFGFQAGFSLNTGNYNNNYGGSAGLSLTSGGSNNNFGLQSGYGLTEGSRNNNFGQDSGYALTTGNDNNNFGYQAGYALTTTSYGINIGYQAGLGETSGSKLHIASNSTLSLLEGTMASTAAAQQLDINADVITIGQNIRPDGDATNAIVIQNAAGDTDQMVFDTTNGYITTDHTFTGTQNTQRIYGAEYLPELSDAYSLRFDDNDSSYPAGWTETDAAELTGLIPRPGFWLIRSNSTDTTFDYRKQSGFDVEVDQGSSNYFTPTFCDIAWRDLDFSADTDVTFAVHADNAGSIDLDEYIAITLRYDQSLTEWQVIGSRKLNTVLTTSTALALSAHPLQQGLFFSFDVQGSTTGGVKGTFSNKFAKAGHTQIFGPNRNATWGDVWYRISGTRGGGGQSWVYLSGIATNQ